MSKLKVKVNLLPILAIVAIVFLLASCSDASLDKATRFNEPQEITCYSGGQVVFKDISTGRVEESRGGAGLYYRSKNTGELVQLYLDCLYTKAKG